MWQLLISKLTSSLWPNLSRDGKNLFPSFSCAAQLGHWFKDYFSKVFEWVLSHTSAVDTTKVGVLGSGRVQ